MKKILEDGKQWMEREGHSDRVRELREQVEKAFTEHPQETGETYGKHLWFTLKMTSRLFYSAIVLLLHGLFPFTFTRTASGQIEKIYVIMKSRIPLQRREHLDLHWDI